MKRGMTIQFSWIYVIIVGAIVIFIALSIISNIKKNAEYSLVSDVKIYVDNAIRNIQQNHGAVTGVNLPDVEIDMFCDSFSVSRKDASGWPLTDVIVFSPSRIKGQMLGYSSSFEMPYETEYFSYITSPGVEYVFENSEKGKMLFNMFPNNTDKAFKADEGEKNYQTRYFQFANTFSSGDVIKVAIIEDEDNFPNSFGKVFYGTKEVIYMNQETLLGALYSQDDETYNCNLQKTLKKLNIISDLKKEKLDSFSSKYPNCPYAESVRLLNAMVAATKELKVDQASLKNIYELSKEIKKENRLLQRLSCPMIY